MDIVYKNVKQYNCILRAYRLARWANHAWGLLSGEQLAEVWNLCPSMAAFCAFVPGYAICKGWIAEGPAGYGVLGPKYDVGSIVIWIGGGNQVKASIGPGATTVRYAHDVRYAEACFADGMVVGMDGYLAEPRDWARIGRLLIVAEQPTDVEAEGIRESLRNMVGEEPAALGEFDRYFSLTGPEILAGPEVIAA